MKTIKVMKYEDIGPNDLGTVIKNIRQDLKNLKSIAGVHRSPEEFDPSKLRLNVSVEVFDFNMLIGENIARANIGR